MRRNKVFVPNKAGHDYSAAEERGELVFVTTGLQNRYDIRNMYRVWSEALKDSTPEDYIMLTGLNSLCSIGAAVFAKKHGRLNFLVYRNGKYILREVVLDE